MEIVSVRDAKARFSALVEAAENGDPTTITRHGKSVAVLVPVAIAQRLYAVPAASLADVVLACPGGLVFERDYSPLREVDL